MSIYYQSKFVITQKKVISSTLLTSLNLPKGETSDSAFNLVSVLNSPPLEGLGEVKASGSVAILFLKIMH